MKIQVNLTRNELISIVARHLNLRVNDIDVVIDDAAIGKWNELKKWHDVYRFNPNRKIEAIKAVREAYPGTGLADAKYAIESDWNSVIDYVTKHDSLFNFYYHHRQY